MISEKVNYSVQRMVDTWAMSKKEPVIIIETRLSEIYISCIFIHSEGLGI
jgi:hypothetical protein